MSFRGNQQVSKETLCARCSNPADKNGDVVVELWGYPICYPCVGDWEHVAPTMGDIAKTHGWDNTQKGWQEFTDKWMKKSKRGAA
jgi:hypothetical protein